MREREGERKKKKKRVDESETTTTSVPCRKPTRQNTLNDELPRTNYHGRTPKSQSNNEQHKNTKNTRNNTQISSEWHGTHTHEQRQTQSSVTESRETDRQTDGQTRDTERPVYLGSTSDSDSHEIPGTRDECREYVVAADSREGLSCVDRYVRKRGVCVCVCGACVVFVFCVLEQKSAKSTRCGTRTRNPQIRSLIRYPLRQPRLEKGYTPNNKQQPHP